MRRKLDKGSRDRGTTQRLGCTLALAEFDAETRFRARAALGSREQGLRLLDELHRSE